MFMIFTSGIIWHLLKNGIENFISIQINICGKILQRDHYFDVSSAAYWPSFYAYNALFNKKIDIQNSNTDFYVKGNINDGI